jgi:hypothetical protein
MFDKGVIGVTVDIETYDMLQRCKRECERCLKIANEISQECPNGENAVKARNIVMHLENILGLKETANNECYREEI